MADPERRVRLKQLESAVQGIIVSDQSKPSPSLIDTYADVMEKNTVSYVQWKTCISRTTQPDGGRNNVSRQWGQDKRVREIECTTVSSADYSSDIKLFQILARGGMAIHMTYMLGCQVRDRRAQTLMTELHQPPPQGYHKVTVGQLQRADLEVWTWVSEMTRDQTTEEAFTFMMSAPQVRLLLLPSPKSSASSSGQNDGCSRVAQSQHVSQQSQIQQVGIARNKAKVALKPNNGKVSKSQKREMKQTGRVSKYESSETPKGFEICYAFNNDAGEAKNRIEDGTTFARSGLVSTLHRGVDVRRVANHSRRQGPTFECRLEEGGEPVNLQVQIIFLCRRDSKDRD